MSGIVADTISNTGAYSIIIGSTIFVNLNTASVPRIDYEAIVRSYPAYDLLVSGFRDVEKMDLKAVKDFEIEISLYNQYYREEILKKDHECFFSIIVYPPPNPKFFQEEFDRFVAHKQKMVDQQASRNKNNLKI